MSIAGPVASVQEAAGSTLVGGGEAAAVEFELISAEAAAAATEATVVGVEAAEFAAMASGPLGWAAAAFLAVILATSLVILRVETAAVDRDQVMYNHYLVHSVPTAPPGPIGGPPAPTSPSVPNIVAPVNRVLATMSGLTVRDERKLRGRRKFFV